jgi:6,7-dimethyl-8-ribityllumazine synthase
MSLDPPVYNPTKPTEGFSIAIVAARYNTALVDALIENTVNELKASAIESIHLERVPGSADLPYAASLIEKYNIVDAIIILGVVIAGATEHHSVIAYSSAQAINQTSLEKDIPIINGIIVTNSQEEAEDRCGSKINRGKEFALAAIEMAQLKEKWTKKNR